MNIAQRTARRKVPQRATKRLTPRQLRAVDLLLAGGTVTRVAELVGADRATVHRWQSSREFQRALDEGKKELQAAQEVAIRDARREAAEMARATLDALMLPGTALARRIEANPAALDELSLGQIMRLEIACARALPSVLAARALALGDVTGREDARLDPVAAGEALELERRWLAAVEEILRDED